MLYRYTLQNNRKWTYCDDCRIFAVERWTAVSKSRRQSRSNSVTWHTSPLLPCHAFSASRHAIIVIIIIIIITIMWVPWRRSRFTEHAGIISHVSFRVVVNVHCRTDQCATVPLSWLTERCALFRCHQREFFFRSLCLCIVGCEFGNFLKF